MKWRSGKVAAWAGVTAFSAVAAFAWGQNSPDPDKGEKILNLSCGGCHDLRPIQTEALDAKGWTKVVNSMIDKGAKISQDDIPTLVIASSQNL